MKQKCREFVTITREGGEVQPACSCNACWDSFFFKHVGRYTAAKLALEKFGEAVVHTGQYAMHAKFILDSMPPTKVTKDGQEVELKPELNDHQKLFIEQQATRYVKQLKRYVRMQQRKEENTAVWDAAVAAEAEATLQHFADKIQGATQ